MGTLVQKTPETPVIPGDEAWNKEAWNKFDCPLILPDVRQVLQQNPPKSCLPEEIFNNRNRIIPSDLRQPGRSNQDYMAQWNGLSTQERNLIANWSTSNGYPVDRNWRDKRVLTPPIIKALNEYLNIGDTQPPGVDRANLVVWNLNWEKVNKKP